MRESKQTRPGSAATLNPVLFPDISEVTTRTIAWESCGVVRSGDELGKAVQTLASVPLVHCQRAVREHYELRNLHTVALLIARCALAREESRGGHFRTDYPETRLEFQKHSFLSNREDVSFA